MKIFPKLLIWFFIVSSVPLGLFVFFTYKNVVEVVLEEELKDLTAIYESKAHYLNEYFFGMEKDAQLMANSPSVIQAMRLISEEFNKGNKDFNSYDDICSYCISFLTFFQNAYSLKNTFLISKEGDVLLTLDKGVETGTNLNTGPYKDSELAKVYKRTMNLLEATISDFSYYEPDDEPVMFIGAPILASHKLLGVFVSQIPPNEIYDLFQDYTGLRETGESLVGIKTDGKILFVNPIRHKPDAAFNLEVELGSMTALPMQQAAQGIKGKGKSIDYRGEKVLAIWDYFPHLQWGIVVKIDLKEVYLPVDRLRNLIIIVGFGTLVFVIILVIRVAKSISNPIRKLHEGAELIGKGNFDVLIATQTKDEIGQLSRAFEKMAHNLKISTTSIEELNEEVEQRKKAEKVKSEFISVISHELRTPIGPIKEGINLVLEEKVGPLTVEQKELLTLAQNNAHRLHYLIDDILDFQKHESGKSKYKFQKNDINQIIKNVFQSHEIMAKQKNLSFQLELSENLPKIYCDEQRIIQVLSNLIGNAIKFTDKGKVVVKTSLERESIQVSVLDTGPGIREQDIPDVFDAFRQFELKTPVKKQGTGLGLAICKQIITDHKGKIWVKSEEGKGSTFYFTLPL